MQRIKPGVDIVMDVLQALLVARPNDAFVKSVTEQYQSRGGLSRKQLEGVYGKASRIDTIPATKLSTLEAIIRKKPVKYKSDAPVVTTPLYERDDASAVMIAAILEKYPEHKRVQFLKTKLDNHEPLSSAEKTDLQRFMKLLK